MMYLNGQFDINPRMSFGDKSLSHRLLILGSIAGGECEIRNLSLCRDVLSTVSCLRRLGATIDIHGSTATVQPIAIPVDNVVLDCGNSGTTARLLAGLVAGLGVSARFVGDEQLSRRPMDGLINALRAMGAKIDTSSGCMFRVLPSRLNGASVVAQGTSAQVKSAVLIAGLFAEGTATYTEKILTRNHTELLMQALGADISFDGHGVATVRRGGIQPFSVMVPNDTSSAAYLVALAAASGRELCLHNVLLNPRRTGLLRLLQGSGVKVTAQTTECVLGEQVGTVTVRPSRLYPIMANRQDVTDAIDEIPLLACLACCAKGQSIFEGVAQLAHKESNRLQAITLLAKSLGQQAKLDGDVLTITSDGVLPKASSFCSQGDHRIAMCGVIFALLCGGGAVDDVGSIDVSFPQFFDAIGVRNKRFALIGSGIGYSLSPRLHTYLASRADVSCSYELCDLPADVSDEELLSAICRFDGVNVTVPFKKRVAKLLGSSLPSVNTVCSNNACSTDGYGLLRSLDSCGFSYKNAPLWVIGAGGAAEAALQALLPFGAKIQLFNRTAEHADELAKKYGLCTVRQPLGILSFVPQCDFLQTLQIPSSVQFVFSASYNDNNSLLERARSLGKKTSDGLQMLYHQGAKSFALWTKTALQDDYNGFQSIVNGTN